MKSRIAPWRIARRAALAACCLVVAGTAVARDDDYQRLADRFDRLAADPSVAQHAPAQLDRARAALVALKDAKRSQREEFAYVAERRIHSTDVG